MLTSSFSISQGGMQIISKLLSFENLIFSNDLVKENLLHYFYKSTLNILSQHKYLELHPNKLSF